MGGGRKKNRSVTDSDTHLSSENDYGGGGRSLPVLISEDAGGGGTFSCN
jgi:hypothetical protein